MNLPETKILIFGARSFAEEVADLAAEVPGLCVVGYVENLERGRLEMLHGLPVYWIDDVVGLAKTHKAVCGLGTTLRRELILQAKQMGFEFTSMVHPRAWVSATAVIGEGSIVSAGSVVAARTVVGDHVVVNRCASIGHHVNIQNYTNIGPGSHIGGGCKIGSGVYIGIGATLIDHVDIGSGSVIGGGAVVTKSLPARVLAVGVPARIVKEDIHEK